MTKAQQFLISLSEGITLKLEWRPSIRKWGVTGKPNYPDIPKEAQQEILRQLFKEAGLNASIYLDPKDYDKVLQAAGARGITIETSGAYD